VLLGIPGIVPLALVELVVVIALVIVVALGEVIILLVLLVSPPFHHVTQIHDSSRAVASKVVVHVLREEAILEAADDILVSEFGNGGSHLEEMPGVGPQGLIHLLLDLGQIMMSTGSDHRSLKVVNEGPFEVLPRVNGVWFEAFKPSEWRGFQGHQEVECLGGVGYP
jgi:hypothetical protein